MSLGDNYLATIRRESQIAVYYRLNEVANAILASDYAAKFGLNGFYAGTPSGGPALIQEDASAGSAIFSSAATNVQVGDASALELTGNLSLECWAAPTTAGQNAVLVSKGNATIKSAPYALSLVNGAPSFSLGNGTTQTSVTSPTALPVGIPAHIVGTVFRGIMTLYVNGVPVATGTVGAQVIADAGQPVWIGAGQQTGSFYVGLLAEVAIYSGALGAKRVLRHFNVGRQIQENPAQYYGIDAPVYS